MEKQVLQSWKANAAEWIKVLEGQNIPSRVYTNKAVVDVLAQLPVTKILDCGCGEGWLTRSMTAIGKTAVGIDATSSLIDYAKTRGTENYYTLSYEEIGAGKTIPEGPFEAAVFNFCLYSEKGVRRLLQQVKKALCKKGYMVIQTIHPYYLMERNLGYRSQWLPNAWDGLPGDFQDGHAWYARTFEDWISLLREGGLRVLEIKEINTKEAGPISVIFLLQ